MESNNKNTSNEWFGYLIRLPDNTSSKAALKYKETKRPRGRQRTIWKKPKTLHVVTIAMICSTLASL